MCVEGVCVSMGVCGGSVCEHGCVWRVCVCVCEIHSSLVVNSW